MINLFKRIFTTPRYARNLTVECNLIHRQNAFTLAETLITIVIVGVIAAITIPVLLQRMSEIDSINKLKATYSIFSQALKMAEIHNGKIETWDIGPQDSLAGAQKLYNYIAPEIIKLQSCNTSNGCFADNYKNLQGGNYPYPPRTWNHFGKGRLNNGSTFLVWSGSPNCQTNKSKTNSGSLSRTCGVIRVDINGDKKPNRCGYDFFEFIITKDGIIPAGTKDFKSIATIECNHSSNASENGMGCTAWVMYKNNFDFKFKDISWD